VSFIEQAVHNPAFHNLTPLGTHIPAGLKSLLGRSLKFCPTPAPLTNRILSKSFRYLERAVRIMWQFRESPPLPKISPIYVPNDLFEPDEAHPDVEDILDRIYFSLHSTPLRARPFVSNLPRYLRPLLSSVLRSDIRVLATDKNLGPAIMLNAQYRQWVTTHLESNTTAYTKVDSAPLDTLKVLVSSFFDSLPRDMQSKSRVIVYKLRATRIGHFYGLPKVHKTPFALRPIVSFTGNVLQGISKWVAFHLQSLVNSIPHALKDSNAALLDVKNARSTTHCRIFTLDIVSLYTSIPIDHALVVLESYLRNHPLGQYLMHAANLILKNNFFEFDGSLWHQISGIAMGNPAAPAIAVLFVAHFESLPLRVFRFNIALYRRYIDDVLLIWQQRSWVTFEGFLRRLQAIPGLSWTFDEFENNAPFLDFEVFKCLDTNTGENTSFDTQSFCTRSYEKALNLFAYVPAASAHPPGMLHGLIMGQILRLARANVDKADFLRFKSLFFHRLIARGYSVKELLPLFSRALDALHTSGTDTHTRIPQVFFKVPFDPNALPRKRLRSVLHLDELDLWLRSMELGKVTVCYLGAKNLSRLLTRTKFMPSTHS